MTSLIIFDLDGTLVDSRQDIATALNLTRNHYGLPPLPVETVTEYIGNGSRKLLERGLRELPNLNFKEAMDRNGKFYLDHLTDQTTLYSGVSEGVVKLYEAGFKLAVLSNKAGVFTRKILSHFQLADYFCVILGGDDLRELKPHPEGILHAMKVSGADASSTWMVGDHSTDLEAAARGNVRSIFCNYGLGNTGDFTPVWKGNSFSEIADYLLRQVD